METIVQIYPAARARRMPPADALRRWRTHHRLKQVDVAERIGVAQSNSSRYERGEDVPRAEVRARIAELTGIEFPS